jgi:hypothetical protein
MDSMRSGKGLARAFGIAVLGVALSQALAGAAVAATCTSQASGDWNVTGTWAPGCTAGGPVAGDSVNIGTTGNHTVTIPAGLAAAAASVTIGDTGAVGSKSLTLAAATSSLTVSGAVTISNSNNNNSTVALEVNAGTATMASLAITGGVGVRVSQLAITTGTATVTGDVSFAGTAANARVVFTAAGTLRIAGAFGNGGTLTAGTGTVEYNGGGAQTVNQNYAYNNLSIDKSGASTATLGGNTTVGGNLTVSAGILDLAAFTANRTLPGGTITVANGATLQIGGTNGFPANYTTHTLGASSTVDYDGTNQTVAAEGAPGYGHLVLSGSGTKTAAGSFTVRGNLSITGVTLAGGLFTHTVNGNVSNTGTHTSITGRIVLSGGSAAHNLSGPGTYGDLELNDANGATLNANVTVSDVLTLTSGVFSTGSNTLITSLNCPGSLSRTGGHVAGFLRLRIPAGASTCVFHVGDSTTYRPISVTFAAGTTTGNLTGSVSQSAGDHPDIAISGLDDTQSVNRYWTLTNAGVGLPVAGYSATFTFVAGDIDGGAPTAQFEIERWVPSTWNNTIVGTRAATSTQATGLAAFGDFAVAKKKPLIPTPGSFNAFESSTAANAVTGVIRTKMAGAAFSLDVVAISSGAQLSGFTSQVAVELLGNNSLGVSLDANNCPTSFTTLQTVTPDPTITSGRSTVNFAAVPNSWRDVRVRVRYPTTSPTVTSCSTDNFAIRPNALVNLTVRDSDWETADPGGTGRTLDELAFTVPPAGKVHKAGRPFTVRATAQNSTGATTTNYAGTTTPTLASCGGAACTATFGSFTLGGAFSGGVLDSSLATYDNVGAFRLQLIDDSFASVDSTDTAGDCTGGGRYVCSGTLDVGRFVPDHFAVSLNAPVFAPTCGPFTYLGQPFRYTTAPQIAVTAQNFANGTTTLYAGNWWRITNTSLAPGSQAARYTAATGTLDLNLLPPASADPAIDSANPGSGAGTLTFGGATLATGLSLLRSTATPTAPFDADISLALNIIDADGVVYASNPARFGQATAGNGISFSGGSKQMRFGRLRLENAVGSERLNLPIPIRTEYWTGTSFVPNGNDSCTAITTASVGLSAHHGGITPANMDATHVSGLAGPFASGVGSLTLTAPTPVPGTPGAVTVIIDLSVGGFSYLSGNWGVPSFTANPTSRAAFGLFGGQPNNFIYFRENY